LSADSETTDLLALSDLTQKDRIQIMLSEYAAIRAEVLARTGYGFQVFGFFTVVLTWVVTQSSTVSPLLFWPVLVAIVAGFVVLDFVNSRDLRIAAEHLKKMEHEINSRAGEHLLVWETQYGIYNKFSLVQSYFRGRPRIPRDQFQKLDSSYLAKPNQRPQLPDAQPLGPPDSPQAASR